MSFAPFERTIYPAPATKAPADDPLFGDGLPDGIHLVRTQHHDPRIDTRHQVLPTVQVRTQASPPPPAPAPHVPWRPLVSDDYAADLELAQLLMQSNEENLSPAALGSLSLDEVVPHYHQPGAKYAYAPSRGRRPQRASPSSASRGSPHPGPATSGGRFSLPPPPQEDLKPFDGHQLRSSHSYPMLVGQPQPLMHQPFAEEPVKAEVVDPTPAPAPPSPTPSISALPAPSVAAAEPTESPQPSLPSLPTGPSPVAAPASGPGPKRSGRAPKRSPAPRRQECKTCGKKFQRPCQLTTHIRSHTGEQPHACPVCSRRFSVLSNCQRHVKLCQKRSMKPVTPGGDETAPGIEPGLSASIITFPDSTSEDAARRSSEIPIRPKLVSHPSGSGGSSLGLERSGSVGSVAEAGAGAGSSSTAPAGTDGYSPAGTAGSGFTPAVYDESGPRSFEPPQTIYEEPGSDYAPNDSTGYDASGSGSYNPSGPDPSSYNATTTTGSYDATNTGSGYDSAPNSAPFGQYAGTYGAQGYGQPSTATGAMEYGHYSHPSPSHVHVRPHPSPSHVHANSPAMYHSPLTMNAPPMHNAPSSMHDSSYVSRSGVVSPTATGIPLSVPSSSMLTPTPPGMTNSHSNPSMSQVPVARSAARRSTMSGFASGYPTDMMPRRQTIVPSMSEPNSFVFQRSPADVINRAFDSEVKLESAEGEDVWSQPQAQASGFQTQQARPAYDWSGSNGRYHPYGLNAGASGSGSTSTEGSGGYAYQQQQQQQHPQQQQSQMYAQSAGGFESFKVEQTNDAYSSGIAYGNATSSSYAMSSEPDSGDVKMPQQQHYSDYSWSQWDRPNYSGQNQ